MTTRTTAVQTFLGERSLRTLTGLLALLAACGGAPESAQHVAQAGSTAAAVRAPAPDSCAPFDAQARDQNRVLEPGETIPAPNAGSWSETRRVALDSFSLELPVVAQAKPRDAHGAYWVTGFPGCRYFCALEIHIDAGAARDGLAAYVKQLRTPDTTGNPDAEDWIPGEPRPVRVGARPGFLMEQPCGDCTAELLVVAVGPRVVSIEMNLDDREGTQPGLMCRLTRAATTFRWASD